MEIDAYKNIVEDAGSILDVVDVNRAHDAYQQLAVAGNSKSTGRPPAKKTPGRQHLGFTESALPVQHVMKPKLEESYAHLPILGHRPDIRNIDSSGPEAVLYIFGLIIQSENVLVTKSKAIPTHNEKSNMKWVLK